MIEDILTINETRATHVTLLLREKTMANMIQSHAMMEKVRRDTIREMQDQYPEIEVSLQQTRDFLTTPLDLLLAIVRTYIRHLSSPFIFSLPLGT
jgi:hypothetical protein